jgi:hypothetical protein
MSNPIDEEVYGHKTTDNPASVRNGNPGRPQSDFVEADDHPDLAKTEPASGEEQAARNPDDEPAG